MFNLNRTQAHPSLGHVAFDAYGNAGPNPWRTFDGREMPRWESLTTPAGGITMLRWEEGVRAAIEEYCRRTGVPFVSEGLSSRLPEPPAR